jgi:ATP-dependent Clp protease ATP-binding subunit ClpC
MNKQFSNRVLKVIELSRKTAQDSGQNYIGPEHLLAGILIERDNLGYKVLNSLDLDLNALKKELGIRINSLELGSVDPSGKIPLSKKAEKILKVTFLEAKLLKSGKISPEHLVLSILRDGSNGAAQLLQNFDVDYGIYK